MTTEEKLKAIQVIAKETDKTQRELDDLKGINSKGILTVSLNHGDAILINEGISSALWHLMEIMLTKRKEELIDKAKELMK